MSQFERATERKIEHLELEIDGLKLELSEQDNDLELSGLSTRVTELENSVDEIKEELNDTLSQFWVDLEKIKTKVAQL